MNLYLRLLITFLRSWRAPRLPVDGVLERTLRVLPNDLDINGHMNNGRYLTVVDLLLVEFFMRTGLAGAMLRQGWRPMSGGSFITYRRGLKPFSPYVVRMRLEGVDDHWNYLRFEFVSDGKVCAAGYMKGAAVGKGGLIANAQTYAAMQVRLPEMPLSAPVQNWLAAEKGVMSAAW